MHETPTTGLFSPPALLYLGMGLVTARILLEGTRTRGLKWLEWLQLLIKAASITLLWPLVLFLERFEAWLKDIKPAAEQDEITHTVSAPASHEAVHDNASH
ncbi:MAG: hypothetical protein ACOYYS_07310 [Chloroflexota bacterium]